MKRINIRKLSPLAGLATLLLIGALVSLAAPHGPSQTHAAILASSGVTATASAPTAPSTQVAGVVHKKGTAAPASHTAPLDPTAPAATPTDTPVSPAPTATPTPAPSWHTMGTWSGSAGETLPTIPLQGDVRLDWTCSPTPSVWDFQFGFANMKAGGIISCNAEPTGSQIVSDTTGASSTALTIYQDGDMGTWTVTVEELY